MNKVLVIGGLTATGKSKLAIQWAKEFNGEILSVDSVAVYKQLSIASAKVSKLEQKEIVHYGIDIADINNPISVKDFVEYGRKVIEEIHQKGKLPILVGGSGLYLKALLFDYEFIQEENQDTSWSNHLTNEQLHKELELLDYQQSKLIHPNNRKRLVRALSIIKTHGVTKSEINSKQEHKLMYDTFLLFLDGDRKLIRNRIEKRVDDMITKGLLQEIEEASKVADWSLSSMSAIGVKEWKDYFENKRSLEDTIELIKTRTKQFSKRQRTWFKHQFDGYWIDIENESDIEKAKLRILQWKQHLTE